MKWCCRCRIIINVKGWWQRHVHWGFSREFFLNKCPFTPARREIEIACMEQRESLWRVGQCLMTNPPPCHQKHLTKRWAGHGGNGRQGGMEELTGKAGGVGSQRTDRPIGGLGGERRKLLVGFHLFPAWPLRSRLSRLTRARRLPYFRPYWTRLLGARQRWFHWRLIAIK